MSEVLIIEPHPLLGVPTKTLALYERYQDVLDKYYGEDKFPHPASQEEVIETICADLSDACDFYNSGRKMSILFFASGYKNIRPYSQAEKERIAQATLVGRNKLHGALMDGSSKSFDMNGKERLFNIIENLDIYDGVLYFLRGIN